MMDYPCARFGDFSFSRFGFIVRTNRETDRQNTEADQRHTHATTVSIRKIAGTSAFGGLSLLSSDNVDLYIDPVYLVFCPDTAIRI